MIGLFCFVLAVLASPFKSKLRLEAENAVLRHQLNVLRRRPHGRVRLTTHDRLFFTQLYRGFPAILNDRLLDLAVRAREIFEKRSPAEKRRLPKIALSNCSWKEGKLSGMFRQPFDIIAEIRSAPTDPSGDKRRISPESPEWWARRDLNSHRAAPR